MELAITIGAIVLVIIVVALIVWALVARMLFKTAVKNMERMQSSFFNDDMDRNSGSLREPRRVRGRRLQ
jgi:uncharacterized membrane protein